MEAEYLARKELCPNQLTADLEGWKLLNLTPGQYRKAYDKLVRQHLEDFKYPDKHIPNTKYVSLVKKRRERSDLTSSDHYLRAGGGWRS